MANYRASSLLGRRTFFLTAAGARGMGAAVDPTDPRAFLAEFAPAVSSGSFSGEEIGFEFETREDASSSPRGYAQLGTERNGAFL